MLAILASGGTGRSATLRIANYNIDADTTSGSMGSLSNATALEGVLEGIGSSHLSDNGTSNAQPIDVLALEEVSSTSNSKSGVPMPSTTLLQTIVDNLNEAYGAGAYAFDATSDPTTGDTGGGPSALIYKTSTIKVISATPLGTPSGSDEARAPMQYVLQPMGGYGSAANFYLDVSHTKQGTTGGDATRRNDEAVTITNNLSSLGSGAHLISVGDFNIASSTEATYQTLTQAGAAKLTDIGNPANNWTNSGNVPLLSETATDVQYRDDMQLLSVAANNASGSPGLQYDAGSYTVFGNGGTAALYKKNVTSQTSGPGGSVFTDMTAVQGQALLTDLTEATDHLPIVADYSIVGIPTPEPATLGFLFLAAIFARRRRWKETRSRACERQYSVRNIAD